VKTTVASVLVAVVLLLAAPALADEIRVADLLADPGALDGSEITLVGELIGDYQHRGGEVWVQLNDDPYVSAPLHDGGSLAGTNVGVAVRFPAALFDQGLFTGVGGYRVRGPVVRVTGTWRFHDEGRGGESYLSAESMDVLEAARPISQGGNWPVLLIGTALIVIGVAPVVWRRRRERAMGDGR
jgi:hypothetical protein